MKRYYSERDAERINSYNDTVVSTHLVLPPTALGGEFFHRCGSQISCALEKRIDDICSFGTHAH